MFNLKEDLLVELSQDEMVLTQGGESAWYWIALGAGNTARAIGNAVEAIAEAQGGQNVVLMT